MWCPIRRARRGGGDLERTLLSVERSAWRAAASWLPAVLVLLSLTLLVVVPWVMQQQTRVLHDEIHDVISPARDELTKIVQALAAEMAGTRGYLLTGDPAFAQDHLLARERRDAELPRLLELCARLRPSTSEGASALRDAVEKADPAIDAFFAGRMSKETYVSLLPSQQAFFSDASDRAVELDGLLSAEATLRRTKVSGITRRVAWISTGLALLALIAAADVAILGRRYRALNKRLERYGRRQTALKDAARALGEVGSVREAVALIARRAMAESNACGAFVERAEVPETGSTVEVVASEGEGGPPVGFRAPYPGSLSEEIIESGEPHVVTEVGSIGERLAPYLHDTCPSCTGLVVPLSSEKKILGALVMLRQQGQPSFDDTEVAMARALGDLASAALRRVLLLDELAQLVERERAARALSEEARAEAEGRRAELERVSSSRARLIRGFGHDLKNPLGAADGYLQLMERQKKDPLSLGQRERIAKVRRSLRGALDLIESLLALARAERSEIELVYERFDLRREVALVAEENRAQAEGAGLELRIERGGGPLDIVSDRTRIRQLLGNLLSNAVKYTDRGWIEVRVDSSRHGWVAVEVEDTGRGISLEDQEHVFEEFRRAGSAAGKRGAGIGLAISQAVAHAMGGEVTVESELDKGSTFTIHLPVTPVGLDAGAGDSHPLPP